MYKRIIGMADEFFVIHAGGSIGQSTRFGIGYACGDGKTVRYPEETP
ncbi:MAG: hypothetical protein PUJ12_06035 [Oscillospiraceae bacterium]|nr:hypothetical protein [Oscillospiraceae bacterium]